MKKESVAVLGAGMVGVCCALSLVERGYSVTLIDPMEAGEGTSFGNAGLINRGSIFPLGLNDVFHHLPNALLKRHPNVHVYLRHLPSYWRWLWYLIRHSGQSHIEQSIIALNRLFQYALDEHQQRLIQLGAGDLLVKKGWLKLYRGEKAFRASQWERAFYDRFGIHYDVLCASDLTDLEPGIQSGFRQGVWVRDTGSFTDPAEVVKRYARGVRESGGRFLQATVLGLAQKGSDFTITTDQQNNREPQTVVSQKVVLALGPWSNDLCRQLGYHFPMAWERGYHQHFKSSDTITLNRPVHDVEGGYVLAPMKRGLRLTTGVEFSHRDAAPTPKQLVQAQANAREILPLGEAVGELWVGSRPSMPDGLPVIGEAPRHPGLWFAFGHGHAGVGMGAITGRLVAEMMAREKTLVDMAPFAPERFVD